MKGLQFKKVSFMELFAKSQLKKVDKSLADEILKKLENSWISWHKVGVKQREFVARILAKSVLQNLLKDMMQNNKNGNLVYSKVLFDVRVPRDDLSDQKNNYEYSMRAIDMSDSALSLNPTGCVICILSFASPINKRLLKEEYFYNAFLKQFDEIFGFTHQQNGRWAEWASDLG